MQCSFVLGIKTCYNSMGRKSTQLDINYLEVPEVLASLQFL